MTCAPRCCSARDGDVRPSTAPTSTGCALFDAAEPPVAGQPRLLLFLPLTVASSAAQVIEDVDRAAADVALKPGLDWYQGAGFPQGGTDTLARLATSAARGVAERVPGVLPAWVQSAACWRWRAGRCVCPTPSRCGTQLCQLARRLRCLPQTVRHRLRVSAARASHCGVYSAVSRCCGDALRQA